MKLILSRIYKKENYTIGELFVDGARFCNTLEDKVRDLTKEKKVYGETAIPSGVYDVVVSYSPKFKRDLPLLLNVPQFEGIRIHRGKYPKDTLGCILVGENKVKGGVVNSTKYEVELVKRMKAALNRKETIQIVII